MWRILDGRRGILQKRYGQVLPECHQPKSTVDDSLMYTTNRPERCTQDSENRKSFLAKFTDFQLPQSVSMVVRHWNKGVYVHGSTIVTIAMSR